MSSSEEQEFQGFKGPTKTPAQRMKTDPYKGTAQEFQICGNKVKIFQDSREKWQFTHKDQES